MKQKLLGQYFTKKDKWLRPHINDFIMSSGCSVIYDPFAGDGDLLKLSANFGFAKAVGLDIDPKKGFAVNDSLLNIPTEKDAIIITNPPYLTNYSAKRKGIYSGVERYYSNSEYDDVYLIALEKMLQAQKYVVAIVPETFINNNFRQKHKLDSITVIEENCFDDTETPVCVLCFDGRIKDPAEIKVYKNDEYLNDLAYFEALRLRPSKNIKLSFNDAAGIIALRAVDTTNPDSMIRFMKKDELDYDVKGIKESSRLITIIKLNRLGRSELDLFLKECNRILESYRSRTNDVLLSPFKGNMKNGRRRRRLDYETARAIIEMAYNKLIGGDTLWTMSNCSNTR
jgi:hypothetical protein